jgi:hypothetical protein
MHDEAEQAPETPWQPAPWPTARSALLRELGVAFGAFTAVLLIAMVTIDFNPLSHHIGGTFTLLSWSHVDWNVHYWNLWEFRRFYLGEPVLFHCSAEFFPDGLATLTIQGDPFLKLVGGFLALVLSPEGTFVAMVLLVFLGNAMGGYVLARTITGSRIAGGTLGLVLCFNGAVAWSVNTGNLENGMWLWLCLYLAAYVRVLRTGSRRDALLAAGACVLAAMSNLTVMHQLVPLSGVLLLFRVRSLDRARIASTALMCAVIAVLMLPLLLMFSSEREEQEQNYAVTFFVEHEVSNIGSLALPMLNSYPPKRYLPHNRVEHTDPLDTHEYNKEDADTYWFAFVLIGFAVLFAGRRSAPWLVSGTLFFLLALGPYYVYVGDGSPKLIGLPFQFAHAYVPLYDHIHFPHRIFNFAILAFGVAIALGVERITRFDRRLTAALLGGLILMGAGWELVDKWAVRRTVRQEANPFYHQLAAEEGEFAVITFPLDFGIIDARYLFWQTLHHKPLFNGCVPRYFGEDGIPNVQLLKNNVILTRAYFMQRDYLLDRVRLTFVPIPDNNRLLFPAEMAVARQELVDVGFRYLILHRRVTWEPGLEMVLPEDNALHDFFGSAFGDPSYEDEELVVFPITPPPSLEAELGVGSDVVRVDDEGPTAP